MKSKRLILGAISAILASSALTQHTTPNTWSPLIGDAQGWPNERSGRAIHMIHVPPASRGEGVSQLKAF